MSVKIYQDLRKAIEETKPELLGEFSQAVGKNAIIAFLETHYPLPADETDGFQPSWGSQIVSRAPLIMRGDRSLIARPPKEEKKDESKKDEPAPVLPKVSRQGNSD